MGALEAGESVETLESEEWWSQVWCSVVIASGGGGLDAFRGRKFSSRALVHGEGHVALIGFYACMCGHIAGVQSNTMPLSTSTSKSNPPISTLS